MKIPFYFLTICLPLRILLVVGAYFLEQPTNSIPLEPFIALSFVMSLGFLSSNINSRIINRNAEVRGFAGGVKYWDSLAHATFFSLYGVYLALKIKCAYLVLLFDLIFGIITVLEHYLF
jgi:hypothetical protein